MSRSLVIPGAGTDRPREARSIRASYLVNAIAVVALFLALVGINQAGVLSSYARGIVVVSCIAVILALAFCSFSSALTLSLIGLIGFLCSCVFPIILSMAVQRDPAKANLINGLMITAVAGGGAVTPLIGWATDSFGTITAGICVLLLCAVYLTYCAFGIKVK